MQNKVRFIGLDAHKDSIMIAVAGQRGEPKVLKPHAAPVVSLLLALCGVYDWKCKLGLLRLL